MPETPKPALTAEEWAAFRHGTGDAFSHTPGDFGTWFEHAHGAVPVVPPHALAALCLYGQPFGFTRDDVETLRLAATNLHHFGLVTLADRIDALLPPA